VNHQEPSRRFHLAGTALALLASLIFVTGCTRGDAAESAGPAGGGSTSMAVDAETHARQVDRMTQVGFLTGQGTSLDLVVSAGALRQAQINRALRDFDLVRARIDALLALADCRW
jgi:hypothetical protein